MSALLDWEEAQRDWLVWDLATAVSTLGVLGERLDRDAAERFVAAYGTSPPQDDELIVPLIRVKRVLEMLRAPTDREPRWDHRRHNAS